MDRRSFLKLFAAAAPVAVVAPTYFFAPRGGWPQRFLSVDYGCVPDRTVAGLYLVGDPHSMIYLSAAGVYENGRLISATLPPINDRMAACLRFAEEFMKRRDSSIGRATAS
jgi:hypothetical protein